MKRLVCEMCGSTELIKQDGVFVCQSCGCKYSVEEAKKMMVEGTVEVTGTISVDRSNEVENRLANAINEFKNGNNDVAFSICSEILNIDPDNYRAILFKGLADGWRSSIDMPKLDVASSELQRAIGVLRKNTVSDDEYTEKSTEALVEMQRLATAYFSICDNANQELQNKFDMLLAKASEATEMSKRVRQQNPYAAMEYINQAKQYFNAANEIAGEKRKQYANRCANAVQPLNALGVCVLAGIRNKEEVGEHFCAVMKDYLDCDGAHFLHALEVAPKIGDGRAYMVEYMKELNSVAKQAAERKRKEKIDEYWAAHAEEKAALLDELNVIEEKLNPLTKQLKVYEEKINELDAARKETLPATIEYEKQRDMIRELEKKRISCGIFQGKMKKELDERLSKERPKLDELNEKRMADEKEHMAQVNQKRAEIRDQINPLESEIAGLNNRKNEINDELTRDR